VNVYRVNPDRPGFEISEKVTKAWVRDEKHSNFGKMPPQKKRNAAQTPVAGTKRYKKLSQIEHIKLRPDMYIGGVKSEPQRASIFGGNSVSVDEIFHSDGLFKIFDEVLVNACDQVQLGASKSVSVCIDEKSISVENDSAPPLDFDDEYGVFIPELIFGHLLTSSNYDDSIERTVGGKNGLGVKLANIFSKKFSVEIHNGGQKYSQEFSGGMTHIAPPKLRGIKNQKQSTKIVFEPDESVFCQAMTSMGGVLAKRVLDAAMIFPHAKFVLNGKRIACKKLSTYMAYHGVEQGVVEGAFGEWRVALAFCPDGRPVHASFVNGICTKFGGTHIDAVWKQIRDAVPGVPIAVLKQHVHLVVVGFVINPDFDSQSKNRLTTKIPQAEIKIPEAVLKKVRSKQFGLHAILDQTQRLQTELALKKTDGKKKARINIPKLDDANFAGTKKSGECALILTEGDSAKTFAVSGLSVVGRDRFGVFPLKGKVMNTKNMSVKRIAENTELNNLRAILGLRYGTDYSDPKNAATLRYGKIIIATDADVDGFHIRGLVMNALIDQYPTLAKIPDFFSFFITPILKASWKGQKINFFRIEDFDEWKRDRSGYSVKYYKGLGTSSATEAKEYFSQLGSFVKPVSFDAESGTALEIAFGNDTNARKTWLSIPTGHADDAGDVSSFVYGDLRDFSLYNIERSIPDVIDGLKPSQRKVLYTCLQKKITKEIKVSQLAGIVSEFSSYHHGENSLVDTIIGMAQSFCGTNNVNLLEPVGQFGSRLMNGNDSASGRYIFTHLSEIARKIFMVEDDAILEYRNDDGSLIEPTVYLPVLPLILVNGCSGIATGWSTSVPPHKPDDVRQLCLDILDGKTPTKLVPYYKGFGGTITPRGDDDGCFECRGVYEISRNGDDTIMHVTEIPIGISIERYKEFLVHAETTGKIKTFSNNSNDTDVDFTIEVPGTVHPEKIEREFSLTSTISTTNMNLLAEGSVVKFENAEAIARHFCERRLAAYEKRRENILKSVNEKIAELMNRIKFINSICDRTLEISGVPLEDARALIVGNGLVEPDALLSIPIKSLTLERVQRLKMELENMESTRREYMDTTPTELFRRDLNSLEI
jgi:DNA topoisomerase-2